MSTLRFGWGHDEEVVKHVYTAYMRVVALDDGMYGCGEGLENPTGAPTPHR